MQHHHLTPGEWDAIAAGPQFQALLRARRRFVVPASIFFLAFYLALPVSVGFYPAIMSRPFAGQLTNAYAFALAQFAMAWILLGAYMWRAKRFDEMQDRIVELSRSELTK